MTENTNIPAGKHNIWVRGLYMLLIALIFHVVVMVMSVVAIIQFVLAVLSDVPNERLKSLGRNLGIYMRQITVFLTFASEEVPFPFSDWPSGA